MASISGYDYLDKNPSLKILQHFVCVCVQSNYGKDHLFSFEYHLLAQGTELINEAKSS